MKTIDREQGEIVRLARGILSLIDPATALAVSEIAPLRWELSRRLFVQLSLDQREPGPRCADAFSVLSDWKSHIRQWTYVDVKEDGALYAQETKLLMCRVIAHCT